MRKNNVATTSETNLVRVAPAMGVLDAIRDLGFDPQKLLSRGGFEPAIFGNPENHITFKLRGELMAYCARATGCAHFGLLAGRPINLQALGLVGQLVKQSQDVATALDNLSRYHYINARGAAIHFLLQEKSVIVSYQIQEIGAAGNDQLGPAATLGVYNVLKELCGPSWQPTEVCMMQRQPKNTEIYQTFFNTKIRFNAGQYALIFPAKWLDHRLPKASAQTRRLIQREIDALAETYQDNFPAQVRTALRAGLVDGDVSANRVARLFSLHPRTLNRRLQGYGSGYQALLDETRFNVAQQMLEASDLSVNEVAHMLVFSDKRAFVRAFRRWSGTTPARWRIQVARDMK